MSPIPDPHATRPRPMTLLAIDTTTTQSSAAVARTDGDAGAPATVLAFRRERVTTHSESLLTMVRDVLAEAGTTLAGLDGIACGAGPGSFTGLRIGLATAKGLCFATGLPIVLVSSLATLAARAPAGVFVWACLDAFKSEVYAAPFRSGLPPVASGPEEVLPPAALALRIAALGADGRLGAPLHLVGDALVKYPKLELPGAIAVDIAPPDAVEVARLGLVRLARGERDDLASAAPRYVRASEAEMLAAMRK